MSRFDFANDFSGLAPAGRSIALTPEDLESRLEDRASEAYARGFADASTLEQNAASARLAATFEAVAGQIATMAQDTLHALATQRAEAARIAIAFARKLAGAQLAADPLCAAEEAFASLIGDLQGQREVAVSVHPDLAPEAETRLADCARRALAAFTLRIVADPDIPPGDCRILWSDGGLIRTRAEVTARLDQLVARILPPEEPVP